MSHGAYAVVMLCVLCVLLIACVAQCFVTDDRDVMFGRVLTPTPVVLSAVLSRQLSFLSLQDDTIAHLFATHTKKDGGVLIAGDYRYMKNFFTVGEAYHKNTCVDTAKSAVQRQNAVTRKLQFYRRSNKQTFCNLNNTVQQMISHFADHRRSAAQH